MSDFAKLFRDPTMGQILVTTGRSADGDDTYEVRFSFQPPDLGVCHMAMKWPDNEEGWSLADEYFDRINETLAIAAVSPHFKMAASFATTQQALSL